MKFLKNDKFNGIILSIAFTFNILLFAPLEMYYTNKLDLWFYETNICVIAIPLTIFVAVIMSLILVYSNKKERKLPIRIVATILTTLYIQGNFLNFGYGVLDGSDIEWLSMIIKGLINTAIWLFLIIFPFEIKKIKERKNLKVYTSILSMFILGIEIITLITLLITNQNSRKRMVLSNKDILNFSDKNNIVVIMSDTFEATYMNEILEEHPEFKEKLKDFVYFDNATSASFYTYSSLPTLMTGVPCNIGYTLQENLDYCFENTDLYRVLKEKNYKTEIYVEDALIPKYDYIDNLTEGTTKVKLKTNLAINKNMYKAVLYRYLPHFLKAKFVISGDEFSKIKSNNDELLDYKEKYYSLDDIAFNNCLVSNGIEVNEDKNTFKFYEFDGMHRPYYTTVDLQYDESDEYSKLPVREKRYNEGIASLKILSNYVEELKKNGVYDNTTIIFLADHGYENRFHVNLLVKKANSNHDFQISSAPVSTRTDLIPTILNIATNSKDYGKDFFDFKEDETRTRQVYDYTYQVNVLGRNDYHVISRMIFESDEHASNKEAFRVVEEEYRYDDKKLTENYVLGTNIDINDIQKSKCVNLRGFALERVNLSAPMGANINKNAYLTVKREKSEKDVEAQFFIERAYGSNQVINFKINGENIYSTKFAKNIPKLIKFTIPKEEWNLKDLFSLEMEFPNAILGKEEFTMMMAIKLKNIVFSEVE